MSRQQMLNDENHWQDVRTFMDFALRNTNLPTADKGERGNDDMGLIATNKGGDYEKCPTGMHRAVAFGVTDLGTQPGGQYAPKHKVLIQWELSDTQMSDGRPFAISKRYTSSTNEKSNLRLDLESWRGRAFTPDEIASFDIRNILGAPCYLNVIEEPKRDGSGTYTKIASVSPLPKGVEKPIQINPSVAFDMDAPDAEQVYAQLPEWIQRTIAESAEWQARGQVAPPEDGAPPLGVPAGFEDDDIPFATKHYAEGG